MANWEQVDTIIDRVEEGLISILLGLMIFIAFLQIVLRNIFATGLFWADPLVRNLVLWVGFVGAAIATRAGRHITIDIMPQWVPPLGKAMIGLITQLFSAVICGLLTFAAFKFVRNEALMGSVTFLGIPAWVPQIIMPITFGIMSLQFLFHSLQTLSKIIRKEKKG
ncbi:MAG: TRAP transporter small permease [Deltaproteobacteria bacterium]|nr:TRAP transporter small permease [Deltaproteobacteria bacterium]